MTTDDSQFSLELSRRKLLAAAGLADARLTGDSAVAAPPFRLSR
jgi:hypothetical protein